ncbi:MAG TPA: hypothetical protein VGF94_19110 [Kofleriaceae bacterium]
MRMTLACLLLAACSSSDVSRSLGAECTSNYDCSVKCLAGGPWPDGFCTTLCDSDDQCPSDAHCISEQGGVCAFACEHDPDCTFLGSGYTCQGVGGPGGQAMVCRGG